MTHTWVEGEACNEKKEKSQNNHISLIFFGFTHFLYCKYGESCLLCYIHKNYVCLNNVVLRLRSCTQT